MRKVRYRYPCFHKLQLGIMYHSDLLLELWCPPHGNCLCRMPTTRCVCWAFCKYIKNTTIPALCLFRSIPPSPPWATHDIISLSIYIQTMVNCLQMTERKTWCHSYYEAFMKYVKPTKEEGGIKGHKRSRSRTRSSIHMLAAALEAKQWLMLNRSHFVCSGLPVKNKKLLWYIQVH